jgi:CubicO group peptidase (beta-lactamase class C family)
MADRATNRCLDAVRGVLDAHLAKGAIAGAVALIGRGDESHVVTMGGQRLGGEPMQHDSLFRIASMTKPITAVAALMLIEEGKLALDEPVYRLLPELANRRVLKSIDSVLDDTVPAHRSITVEDLLTFRLGLGIVMAPPGQYPIQRAIADLGLMGFGPPDPTAPLSPDEWIAALGTLPLMSQPGEKWLYTTGSNVLGVLIARASGHSLPDFFRDRIFGPLGMTDTAFYVAPKKLNRLTDAYQNGKSGLTTYDSAAESAWGRPPTLPAGDSGLVSTAPDLFAFSRLLLDHGRHAGSPLLSQASIAAMTRNQITPDQAAGGAPILAPGQGWGHGLAVWLEPSPEGAPAGSFGWNGGLGTSWIADPASDLTLILLTQTLFDNPAGPAVHRDFQRAAFAALSS